MRAQADRAAAEQAAVDLARREFGPDIEVSGAYDTFWQENPLRAQAGLRVNLPVRSARRPAAVAEAHARLARRQAELARLTDRVDFEAQEVTAPGRPIEPRLRDVVHPPAASSAEPPPCRPAPADSIWRPAGVRLGKLGWCRIAAPVRDALFRGLVTSSRPSPADGRLQTFGFEQLRVARRVECRQVRVSTVRRSRRPLNTTRREAPVSAAIAPHIDE